MFSDVTRDFKAYHFSIVDQITDETDAQAEQEILTEHELKVMNIVDRIGKIIEVHGSVGKVRQRKDHSTQKYGLGGNILQNYQEVW